MHFDWNWVAFENFRGSWVFVVNLNLIWHWNLFQISLTNTWSKVWEELTWHSKNVRRNVLPKSLNSNLNFIWDFQKLFFLVWVLPLEKCPRCRINSPENFDIYMSYIKIIYIFLYFPFSLIQKKRSKAPGASQANRPSKRQPAQPAGQAPARQRPSRGPVGRQARRALDPHAPFARSPHVTPLPHVIPPLSICFLFPLIAGPHSIISFVPILPCPYLAPFDAGRVRPSPKP